MSASRPIEDRHGCKAPNPCRVLCDGRTLQERRACYVCSISSKQERNPVVRWRRRHGRAMWDRSRIQWI